MRGLFIRSDGLNWLGLQKLNRRLPNRQHHAPLRARNLFCRPRPVHNHRPRHMLPRIINLRSLEHQDVLVPWMRVTILWRSPLGPTAASSLPAEVLIETLYKATALHAVHEAFK